MKTQIVMNHGDVVVNGQPFDGRNITITSNDSGDIVMGKIIVDGVEQAVLENRIPPHEIVIRGSVESIHTDYGRISCGDVNGDVSTTSGSIACNDVNGNVSTISGTIRCDDVAGNVSTVSGMIKR